MQAIIAHTGNRESSALHWYERISVETLESATQVGEDAFHFDAVNGDIWRIVVYPDNPAYSAYVSLVETHNGGE
jgi:hypothetical protein